MNGWMDGLLGLRADGTGTNELVVVCQPRRIGWRRLLQTKGAPASGSGGPRGRESNDGWWKMQEGGGERGGRGVLGLQGIAFSPPQCEININSRQASKAAPLMEN